MEDQFETLLKYVIEQRQNGIAEDALRKMLLDRQWDENLVNQVFVTYHDLLAIPPPPPPPEAVTPQSVQQQLPTTPANRRRYY